MQLLKFPPFIVEFVKMLSVAYLVLCAMSPAIAGEPKGETPDGTYVGITFLIYAVKIDGLLTAFQS